MQRSLPPSAEDVPAASPLRERGASTHHTMLASSSFSGRALAFKAQQQRSQRPHALEVVAKESRIGKQPVPVPDKVTVTLDGNLVMVKVRGGGATAWDSTASARGWDGRPGCAGAPTTR